MKQRVFKRMVSLLACAGVISSSSVGFCVQIYENSGHVDPKFVSMPIISVTLAPKTIKYPNGTTAQATAEVSSGIDLQAGEPQAVTAAIKDKLGITEDGERSFPIRKIAVFPQDTNRTSIQFLKNYFSNILPDSADDVEEVRLPDSGFHDWFVRNNNIVYTVIRFVLNGITIGATLIYSLKIPLASALLVGLLAGSMSSLIQYNIVSYRDWLQNDDFIKKFQVQTYDFEGSTKTTLKEFYNNFLSLGEQYGKFGLSETVFISMARLAMWLIKIPSENVGLSANLKNVLKTSLRSTIAQGVAELGLFKDMEIQKTYGGWNDEFRGVFRNTSIFLISAASVAVAALQLVRPGLGGVVDLGFLDLPVGFAAITAVGIGFYIHAFFTYWFAKL